MRYPDPEILNRFKQREPFSFLHYAYYQVRKERGLWMEERERERVELHLSFQSVCVSVCSWKTMKKGLSASSPSHSTTRTATWLNLTLHSTARHLNWGQMSLCGGSRPHSLTKTTSCRVRACDGFAGTQHPIYIYTQSCLAHHTLCIICRSWSIYQWALPRGCGPDWDSTTTVSGGTGSLPPHVWGYSGHEHHRWRHDWRNDRDNRTLLKQDISRHVGLLLCAHNCNQRGAGVQSPLPWWCC